nr:probable E3 ubiquitin-protein ligase RHG1A [Ipomoea batatas]
MAIGESKLEVLLSSQASENEPKTGHNWSFFNFQNPTNWGLANGNTLCSRDLASTSEWSHVSGPHSSSPSLLAPILVVRLTMGPQLRASSSVGSPKWALPGYHGHRPSSSRSAMLLERHLELLSQFPYSWRTWLLPEKGRR